MKTIEQRADDYVGHPEEIDEFSSASIKRQAFIWKLKQELDRRLICGLDWQYFLAS